MTFNNGPIVANRVYFGSGHAAGGRGPEGRTHQSTSDFTAASGDLFLGRQSFVTAPEFDPSGFRSSRESFSGGLSAFVQSIFGRQSLGKKSSRSQTGPGELQHGKESLSEHNGDSTAWKVVEKDETMGKPKTTTAYREVEILNGKKGKILGGLSVRLKTVIGPTSELVVAEQFDTAGDVELTGKLFAGKVTVKGMVKMSDSSEVRASSAEPTSIKSLVMKGNSVMTLSGGGNVTLPAVQLAGNATIDLSNVVLSGGSVFQASGNATILVKIGTDTTRWVTRGYSDIIYTRS